RGRRHVGEQPEGRLAPLEGPRLVVAVQPELGVEALESGQVDFELLGQLADVELLELTHLPFLLVQSGLDLIELDLQEVRGPRGLSLADLEVLLDVEGGEGVRDLGHRLRVAPAVADGEGDGHPTPLAPLVGPSQLELDVATHPLDDLLGADALLKIGVEAEPADELLEARSTQDLLADRLEPGFQRARDRGSYQLLGD